MVGERPPNVPLRRASRSKHHGAHLPLSASLLSGLLSPACWGEDKNRLAAHRAHHMSTGEGEIKSSLFLKRNPDCSCRNTMPDSTLRPYKRVVLWLITENVNSMYLQTGKLFYHFLFRPIQYIYFIYSVLQTHFTFLKKKKNICKLQNIAKIHCDNIRDLCHNVF